jgi:hypothetical protein
VGVSALVAPALAYLLSAGGVLGTGSGAAASEPARATSASSQLVAEIRSAIAHAGSAHFDITQTVSGVTDRVSGDAGPDAGSQELASGASRARLIVLPRGAYFSGNRSGLSAFFGMPSADITRVGTRWVAVASSSASYAQFRSSVESRLFTSYLPTSKTVDVQHAAIAGRSVDVLVWTTTSGSETLHYRLTVAATGAMLPIEDVAVSGKNHDTTIFSRWGERLHVRVPTRTVALTSLTG